MACTTSGWSYGLFPNYRNVLWSCNWWDIQRFEQSRYAVETFNTPLPISNGFGDYIGIGDMTPAQQKQFMDLFDKRKQQRMLDKLKRETPEQRAERLREEEEEITSLVREIPKAFDFQPVGDEVVNGRPAHVLQATPHQGYQAQGKYGKMFSKLEGKLWIDKQDFGWIKADGHVIEPFSGGLFLARVLRGSHITMEQMRTDEGIWVPEHVEVRAAAKIFLVKSLLIDRILTYSEYRLAEAAEPVAPDNGQGLR
jgi:hypothetical protein